MPSTPGRRRLLAVLLLAGIGGAVELLSKVGWALLERKGIEYRPLVADQLSPSHRDLLEGVLAGRPSLFRHDPVLGWSLSPGFRSELCSIGLDGLRRDPARPEPNADAVSVAIFGDSFAFGGDVADRFAFPEVLARLDAGLAIENFGVPAYGLDQAYLRFLREGRARRPQIVVIGFMSENIFRNVSVFRPFYRPSTQVPFAKPRYRSSRPGEPSLTLVENPLPSLEDYRRLLARPAETLSQLGRHDFFYGRRPRAGGLDASAAVRLVKLARAELWPGGGILRRGDYNVDSEAFRVTTGLLSTFYETALRDGAQPVILVFPERGDLDRWRATHTKRYTPLLQALAVKGYRVVDAMTALDTLGKEHPARELIPSHFSPLANQILAGHLLEQMRHFGLVQRP